MGRISRTALAGLAMVRGVLALLGGGQNVYEGSGFQGVVSFLKEESYSRREKRREENGKRSPVWGP